MVTIRKQGNNWQVVYEVECEKFVRSVGQDDLTAKIKQLEMKRLAENIKAGKVIVPSGMERKELGEWAWRQVMPQDHKESTVGELIDGYLSSPFHAKKAFETARHDEYKLKHLKKALGTIPLSRLTEANLQGYIDKRKDGRIGNKAVGNTIQKEVELLRAVWNGHGLQSKLVKQEWRIAFPVRLIYPKYSALPKPKPFADCQSRQDMRSAYLNAEEVNEMLSIVKERSKDPAYYSLYKWVYPAMVYCCYTSFRRGTMMKQLVEHVDFKRHEITGRIGKEDNDYEETLRTVPMMLELEEVLADWLKVHPGGKILFCNDPDEMLLDGVASRGFWFYLRGTKYSRLPGWHRLRHSFVSVAAAKEIPFDVVKEFTGHHSEDTARIYRHLAPNVLAEKIRGLYS